MASWRQLTAGDIGALLSVANVVHTELPESFEVFAERVRLFPDGCLALTEGDHLYGYTISHPIRRHQPPALDSLLDEIAPDADQYYIHDVCILPSFRKQGYATQAISKLLEIADLVSVYGTEPFWGRYGFRSPDSIDEVLAAKIRGYGDDAAYLERPTSIENRSTVWMNLAWLEKPWECAWEASVSSRRAKKQPSVDLRVVLCS